MTSTVEHLGVTPGHADPQACDASCPSLRRSFAGPWCSAQDTRLKRNAYREPLRCASCDRVERVFRVEIVFDGAPVFASVERTYTAAMARANATRYARACGITAVAVSIKSEEIGRPQK